MVKRAPRSICRIVAGDCRFSNFAQRTSMSEQGNGQLTRVLIVVEASKLAKPKTCEHLRHIPPTIAPGHLCHYSPSPLIPPNASYPAQPFRLSSNDSFLQLGIGILSIIDMSSPDSSKSVDTKRSTSFRTSPTSRCRRSRARGVRAAANPSIALIRSKVFVSITTRTSFAGSGIGRSSMNCLPCE